MCSIYGTRGSKSPSSAQRKLKRAPANPPPTSRSAPRTSATDAANSPNETHWRRALTWLFPRFLTTLGAVQLPIAGFGVRIPKDGGNLPQASMEVCRKPVQREPTNIFSLLISSNLPVTSCGFWCGCVKRETQLKTSLPAGFLWKRALLVVLLVGQSSCLCLNSNPSSLSCNSSFISE